MSLLQANLAGLGGSGAPGGALAGGVYSHELNQSLHFEDGNSAQLSRTPSSAGNQKTWTWSSWVKRSTLGATQTIFCGGTGSTLSVDIAFGSSDNIIMLDTNNTYLFITTAVFRDTSAWYHIVVENDTTQATVNNRTKLYVNGEQITSFSTDNRSNFSQDEDTGINSANIHYIGRWINGGQQFDGYMAEINFIDGTALDADNFGETVDGVWVPKQYSGSYGTNGFHLSFSHDTVSEGFTPVLYTGTGSTDLKVMGTGFSPDLIWIKRRDNTQNFSNALIDTVRGNTKNLVSNRTDAESTSSSTNDIQSFDSDGFTTGPSNQVAVNDSGGTFVAWCWEAGGAPTADNSAGAGATPTAGSVKIDGSNLGSALAGSIAATRLSANTTKGFSIVTYTGNATAGATVAHGLSSTPEMIITKGRSAVSNFLVYHVGNTANPETDYLTLETANATNDTSSTWNDTAPTSSVFSIGDTGWNNTSGGNYVAYCWHSVSGYSKFGSYTGSGSSGKAITGLGFRPVFVMIKRTDSSGGWHVFDSVRFPNNPIDQRIEWDNADGENSGATVDIDFDSDGFTLKTSFDNMNASSGEYIYMAFADTRDSVFYKDTSGNLNNFTLNNLDVSDVVPDSPTNNFGTMNPLDKNSMTVSEGNLKVVPSGDYKAIRGTFGIPTSGKWYFEARYLTPGGGNVQDNQIGVVTASNVLTGSSPYPQAFTYGVGYLGLGQINRGGSAAQSSLTAVTAGKILGVAVNVDDDEVQFYLDGSAVGTTEQLVSTTEPNFAFYVGATNRGVVFNFGQDSTFAGATTAGGNADANGIGDFKYAPPSDHLALCTSNLPDITIGPGQSKQADDFFETMLYTGTAAEQHIGAGGAQHPQDTTTIANSVRFEDGDNNYLTKSDQGTSSSDKQFTFSCWVKRGNKGSYNTILGTPEGGDREYFGFLDTNEFIYQINNGTNLITTRKFLDVSSWYHIVVAVNINESTASDRQKIYINGEQITSFSSANYYGSSDTVQFMKNGAATFIGRLNTTNVNSFDGYMAEINFIDGSTLDPTYFGQVGANGYWIPKALSGLTYGTNGFRLTFENSSYLGYDYQTSGRSTTNDFTVSGLAATDQVTDSPTQNFATFDPNNPSGTTLTFSEGNLKAERTSSSFAQAYSTFKVTTGKWYAEFLIDTGNSGVGVIAGETIPGTNRYMGQDSYTYGYYTDGRKVNNATYSSYGDSYSTAADGSGDVIGVLINADDGEISFSKNGTVQNSGTPAFSGVQGPFRFAIASESNCFHVANFGQDDTFAGLKTSGSAAAADDNSRGTFYDTPPSGYLALVDDNIPVEGIASPDFVWIKNRSAAQNHNAFDTVRGAGKLLYPDITNAEYTSAIHLLSFDHQGFTVGSATSANGDGNSMVAWTWKAGGISPTQTYTVKVVSDSGNKYRFDDFGTSAITLSLQEGGTYTFDQSDSSNSGHPLRFSTTSDGTHGGGSEYTTGVTTSGTPGSSGAKTVITVAHGAPTLYYYCTQHSGMGGQANTTETHGSTNLKGSLQNVVSANKEAGFSIVTWTAPNDNGTLGHGLDSAPELIIAKPLGSGTNWYVMHTPGGVVPANNVLNLDATSAKFNPGVNHFNDTYPTSTVFSYGGYLGDDLSNDDKVAYCFHSVEGFSKVGSYVANGNADGTFVYTGFRPAWVIFKNATSTDAWSIFASARDPFNDGASQMLLASSSAVEASGSNNVDFLSNGFKPRTTNNPNTSGQTYIYLAFAEAPFKFANAR